MNFCNRLERLSLASYSSLPECSWTYPQILHQAYKQTLITKIVSNTRIKFYNIGPNTVKSFTAIISYSTKLECFPLSVTSSGPNVIKNYGRNLLMFVIRQSVCPWKAFPAQNNISVRSNQAYTSGAPFGSLTLGQAPVLSHKHLIRLDQPAWLWLI